MTADQEERFVVAFEGIAEALKGIDETQKQQFRKRWPDPKERRDAIITRVPTAEDLIREAHGAGDEPVQDWLNLPEEGEWIGVREREYIRTHADAGAKEPAAGGSAGGSAEAVEGEHAPGDDGAADHLDVPER